MSMDLREALADEQYERDHYPADVKCQECGCVFCVDVHRRTDMPDTDVECLDCGAVNSWEFQ